MASRNACMSSDPGGAGNSSNDILRRVSLWVDKLNVKSLGNLDLHFTC